MRTNLWAMLSALLLAGCGGGGGGGGLEGVLEEAQEKLGVWGPELAERLAVHGSDPRVRSLMIFQIEAEARRSDHGQPPSEVLTLLGQALEKEPLAATEDHAYAIVLLVERQGNLAARSWIEDYDTAPAVTQAILKRMTEKTLDSGVNSATDRIDRLTAELEARKTPTEKKLLIALVGSGFAYPESAAARYLEEGFPSTSTPLGDAKRTPPIGDGRIRAAIQGHLEYLASDRRWPDEKHLTALAEAVRIHVRPSGEPVDEFLKTLIRAGARTSYLDFTSVAAATGDDAAERLRRLSSSMAEEIERTYAVRLSERVENPWIGPSITVIEKLERSLSQAYSKSERDQAARRAEGQLRAMGVKAVPGLERALDSDRIEVRAVAVNVWVTLDPKGLATALSRRMTAGGSVNWYTANQAIDVLSKLKGSEASEFLIHCLQYGGDPATRAAKRLRDRLDTDTFVAALFGLLIRKSSFGTSEIEAYLKVLGSFPKVAPSVAAQLAHHLDTAGGRPEGVYWMIKYLSLRILAVRGDASARPILERLQADKSVFVWIRTKTHPDTGLVISEERETITFSDEAGAALRAVNSRGR